MMTAPMIGKTFKACSPVFGSIIPLLSIIFRSAKPHLGGHRINVFLYASISYLLLLLCLAIKREDDQVKYSWATLL